MLATMIALLCSSQTFAQHGHSANHAMAPAYRPQPRISGIMHSSNANSNAKIHANSNSVFGTGNIHSSSQVKKEDENKLQDDKDDDKKNLKKHKHKK